MRLLTGLPQPGAATARPIAKCRGALSLCKASPATHDVDRSNDTQEEQAAKKRLRFHRLEQTPEERTQRPKPLLDRAEASLVEYCSGLSSGDEASEQCWVAYDYFEQQKDEAEAGCEVDYETFSRKGSDCTRLESFESFIRGLLGHSPMSSFAHLLYTLRKAELHEASADPTTDKPKIEKVSDGESGSRFELQNVPESGKERLVALFQAMDHNGDGRLDTGEFRDAMNKLGMANLTGTTVSTILEAMDIHGPITLDDFLLIVEAEEIYSDSPVSRWFRAKGGESKYWGKPL